VQMSSIYEAATGRVPVRHLGTFWWASLPRPNKGALYAFGKRSLDVIFAALGLACLAMLLPVLWPALRRQTGGSLFFSQVRIGKHGEPFTVHKLRTLRVAQVHATDWRERKAANQPTPLCALIRTMGLDELPQLLNVLRGEMSL